VGVPTGSMEYKNDSRPPGQPHGFPGGFYCLGKFFELPIQ